MIHHQGNRKGAKNETCSENTPGSREEGVQDIQLLLHLLYSMERALLLLWLGSLLILIRTLKLSFAVPAAYYTLVAHCKSEVSIDHKNSLKSRFISSLLH